MKITRKTKLKTILEVGKECERCGQCCQHGSGFLVGDDLKKISEFLEMIPEDAEKQFMEEVDFYNKRFLKPKTEKKKGRTGRCIFLGNKNECKIHEVKPLQCRIGIGCKEHGRDLYSWFLLNYCVKEGDPETIRHYAHYLRAGGKIIPGGELKRLVKDEKKLKKILGTEHLTKD